MSVTWSGDPTVAYDIEWAPSNNPWDTTPTWVSIGAKLRYARTFRGKTSINSEMAPSALEVRLDSRDRLFDPQYTSGTYFGQLLPMKRVRFTITYAAVTYTLFTGWTLGWQQDWYDYDNSVILTATDSFADALNFTLAPSAYSKEVVADAPTVYYPLQDGDLTPRVGTITLTDATLNGLFAGTPSQSQTIVADQALPNCEENVLLAAVSNDGYLYEIPYTVSNPPFATVPTAIELFVYDGCNAGVIAAVNANNFFQLQWSGTGLTVNYNNTTSNRFWNDGLAGPPFQITQDLNVWHIAAYINGTNLDIMVNGSMIKSTPLAVGSAVTTSNTKLMLSAVSTTVTAGSFPGAVDHQATPAMMHVAVWTGTPPTPARFLQHYMAAKAAWSGPNGIYGAERSGARINRILDEIGFPSNLRDISPGVTLQGAYRPAGRNALDALREVERSEQGVLGFTVDGKLFFRDRQWLWTQARSKGVVFSDDNAAGAVPYVGGSPNSNSIETIRNNVTATWKQGAITNLDVTSRDTYRQRSETIDCSGTMDNAQDATNLSKYRLRIDKDPKSIVPFLKVPMRRLLTTTVPKVLGLELADVVDIERTPMNVGAQAVRRHQLLGIEHEFLPAEWNAVCYFGPATPMADEVPYLTLGDATRGKIGAAFGNKIPY